MAEIAKVNCNNKDGKEIINICYSTEVIQNYHKLKKAVRIKSTLTFLYLKRVQTSALKDGI